MLDHNPFLTPAAPDGPAKGKLEQAADRNLVWQSRPAPLTTFEDQLAEGLVAALAAGARELDQIADALNRRNQMDADGAPWSESRLRAALRRLGRFTNTGEQQ